MRAASRHCMEPARCLPAAWLYCSTAGCTAGCSRQCRRLSTPARRMCAHPANPRLPLQNHLVWARGEPAFIKYWLDGPATLRSSAALEAEEGFSQVGGRATVDGWMGGLLWSGPGSWGANRAAGYHCHQTPLLPPSRPPTLPKPQDYAAATLQAFFRCCGVASTTLKRYPSYSQPQLVASQWTLRRLAPLPDGYDWQDYKPWAPDSCPLADDACY